MASKARQLAQSASAPKGRKNLIINGAAVVNQRATETINNGELVGAVDRFKGFAAAGGTFTLAQSTDSPAGFSNSVLATVTSADSSIASGDFYGITQRIEGQNIYHLGYGSSGAKTLTLSFYVKSSVTGTFGGAIRNSAADRSFIFSYTVNSADTWEQKTATIAGDTSGTWLTTNGIGLRVSWSLGDGSSRLKSAGSFGDGNFAGVTGQTNLISTGSATLQLTGVQLEVGSVATEFEVQKYCDTYLDCQRYYYKSGDNASSSTEWFPGDATQSSKGPYYALAADGLQDRAYPALQWPVQMRAAPSISFFPGRTDVANTADRITQYNGATLTTFSSSPIGYSNGLSYHFAGTSLDAPFYTYNIVADAEL